MARLSPIQIYNEARESLASYLDTAYRIGHPLISQERAELIRKNHVIAQKPFIETTPSFSVNNYLREIKKPFVSTLLAKLFENHVLGRCRLYEHQQNALESAHHDDGNPQNLIIATGTGSGKTEAFLLPILSDILAEVENWPDGVESLPTCGLINNGVWRHRRSSETRPAAIRALILYPMNALVNDQASRLRRILACDQAMEFAKEELMNNFVYFGQYTSRTRVSGHWSNRNRMRDWNQYVAKLNQDWASTNQPERQNGDWIRPDGPEMYCRWDMQEAPPDILITNYAMLEYMLLRPIEKGLWDSTKQWLMEDHSRFITVVLDEAHMYTGARGTEVSYLLRRLRDRLGVNQEQVRYIATSATLGEGEGSEEIVKSFAGNLFGAAIDNFKIIRAETEQTDDQDDAEPELFSAVADFQRKLDRGENIKIAARSLLENLGENISETQAADIAIPLAHKLTNTNAIKRLRRLTARKAVAWDDLCNHLWGGLAESGDAEMSTATGGLLAAGSFARIGGDNDRDTPPIIPTRMHMIFRGIPGLWACMRPDCTKVDHDVRGNRPLGKLYAEPRLWCDCGGRVLEIFTCRFCGLIFLGGIPDDIALAANASLWPYEQDMEGLSREERMSRFKLLLMEEPRANRNTQFRSWVTTRITNRDDIHAVKVWDEEGRISSQDEEGHVNRQGVRIPFPRTCPRCYGRAYQRDGGSIREVVEPLDTMGHQAFAILTEEFFRLQPGRINPSEIHSSQNNPETGWGNWALPISTPISPPEPAEAVNEGRKVITFADGRQNAAVFTGDLAYSHRRDVFRQLMLISLQEHSGNAVPTNTLREDLLRLCIEKAIDPLDKRDGGGDNNYWELRLSDPPLATRLATESLWATIKREITDRRLGLEALGLARWLIAPGGEVANLWQMPLILGFNQNESRILLTNVIRILAAEGTVLSENADPYYWYHIPGGGFPTKIVSLESRSGSSFRWAPTGRNRLVRYLLSILEKRGEPTINALMDSIWSVIQSGHLLRATSLGPGTFGIPISLLALDTIPEDISVCQNCGFIGTESIDNTCIRCAGTTVQTDIEELGKKRPNYYRRSARRALDSEMPDPFPLHVLEHTGQIGVEQALIRERHFKGNYLTSGNSPDNPYKDRVDILSVTTTMELGIDIGELSSVGMRNVPPTVANYQQRAGRAGRRGDNVACVFTMALHYSHDQHFFQETKDMVSGQVRFPQLNLDNEEIAHRHIRAWALNQYFQTIQVPIGSNVFGSWGNVGNLKQIGLNSLRQFIDENRVQFQDRAANILPSAMPLVEWLSSLPDDVYQAIDHRNDNQLTLGALMEAQLLPRYGFPIDVVPLWVNYPDVDVRVSEPVQRDRGIALSEFAPGGEVVVDGYIHKSIGLFDPFGDQNGYSPSGWYYDCRNCRNIQVIKNDDPEPPAHFTNCEVCFSPIEPRRVIVPSGFRTEWGKQKVYRGGGREIASRSSMTRLLPGRGPEDYTGLLENRIRVRQERGGLIIVNSGEGYSGFDICCDCGNVLESDKAHSRPIWQHGRWNFVPCTRTNVNRSVLLHKFYSEIALFRIDWPRELWADPTSKSGKASLFSFGFAFLRAAAIHLQIDPSELDMGLQPYSGTDEFGSRYLGGDIYLYDTLPGGAGYAREIAASIPDICRLARDLTTRCPTQCDSACYRCLLDYGNQRYHGLLDRKLATDVLNYILDGSIPCLTPQEEMKLLERLETFKSEDSQLELQASSSCGSFAIIGLHDGRKVVLKPVHSLSFGNRDIRLALAEYTRLSSVFCAPAIELERQPFGIWQQALGAAR